MLNELQMIWDAVDRGAGGATRCTDSMGSLLKARSSSCTSSPASAALPVAEATTTCFVRSRNVEPITIA